MDRSESRAPDRIRGMFDRIAGRYDLLNHLLSFNLDRGWRKAAVAELPSGVDDTVLDLCGGTGDLTVELARASAGRTVICCDFSHEMLGRAEPKFRRLGLAERCHSVEADGLRLPFRDSAFDAVTVAFGVRNFADMGTGFREIRRVLRPGGRLVVLEFSRPSAPGLRGLYGLYLKLVLPRLGDGVSRVSGPYGYLARTIAEFPDAPAVAGLVREAGFAACGWKTHSGGIVAIHTAFTHPART